MRLAFLGTPAFALPTLAAVIDAGHEVAAVYSRAPKQAGRRGLATTPSPVHAEAEARGLAVRTPRTLRDPVEQHAFAALGLDAAVVVAYGLILPLPFLAAPRHGCLNLHPSILPRWRGAAPIQRPIMAGDTETAAAIMMMEEGLDTGPVVREERVAIPPDATAGEMSEALARLGAGLMVEALDSLAAGTLRPRPQATEGVLYAAKIDKAEAAIAWTRSARELNDLVRGLSPSPGAFFEADLGRGRERIKVLRAVRQSGEGPPGAVLDDALTIACGSGSIRLLVVQRAGKAPMAAAEFLRGTPIPSGTRL